MRTMTSLLLLTAALAHVGQRGLDATPVPQPASIKEAMPSLAALNTMSLSYKSLVADYYWLRSLNHFGDSRMRKYNYPNIIPLVERIVALDPYFAAAYHFAGTALTIEGLDFNASVRLLEQGMRYRPDDWKIPFLLGFNSYYFLNDFVRGARALAAAARLPGAPDIAGPLAARLMAEAGQPEIGLELVDSILETITDEQLRESYLERRKLLELELHLKWLNEAAKQYELQRATKPLSVEELVGVGLLRTIPEEPLGGHYFIAENGAVESTNQKLRLRIPQTGRRRKTP